MKFCIAIFLEAAPVSLTLISVFYCFYNIKNISDCIHIYINQSTK
jgi:hypothetical protein